MAKNRRVLTVMSVCVEIGFTYIVFNSVALMLQSAIKILLVHHAQYQLPFSGKMIIKSTLGHALALLKTSMHDYY
jgi:hypothetical protein